MSFFKNLVYSNIFVALVLFGFSINTYFFAALSPDFEYLIFIASSSYALYSAHGIIGIRHLPVGQVTDRHSWIKRNFKLIIGLCITASLFSIYSLLQLEPIVILLLLPSLAIGLFYVFPVIRGKRLRDLPYFKVGIIALVVAYLCCFIPLFGAQKTISLFLLERFLFLVAVTLPFDIRDSGIDSKNGDQSIAIILGSKKTLQLSSLMLALSAFINSYFYLSAEISALYFLFQLTATSLGLYLNFKHSRLSLEEWQYSVYYEGSLLFPGLLLFALL